MRARVDLIQLMVPLWLRLAALGFLLNCKPSEPFLSLYLNETKGLSADVLLRDVYPWSTAGAFIFLLPLAILSELIGCVRVIWIGLACREITRAILVFGEGVAIMAIMQLTYSAGVAVDAIYFAYVYAVAPRSQYAPLTAIVLGAYHAGNVVAALAGELLVDVVAPAWRSNLTPLFYISWATTTLGMVAALMLPPPVRAPPPALARHLIERGARATAREVAGLWRSRTSLRWLAWSLLAASGQAVVLNSFQLQLLPFLVPFGLLEAGVECGLLVGAALGAIPWVTRGALAHPGAFVGLTAVIYGLALLFAALAARGGNAAAPIALNMVAALTFGLQRSVGSAQLARAVSESTSTSRFSLLFSANTLLANLVAAALNAAGAASGWDDANSFYFAVAALQAVLTLVSLPLSGTASELQRMLASDDHGHEDEEDLVGSNAAAGASCGHVQGEAVAAEGGGRCVCGTIDASRDGEHQAPSAPSKEHL